MAETASNPTPGSVISPGAASGGESSASVPTPLPVPEPTPAPVTSPAPEPPAIEVQPDPTPASLPESVPATSPQEQAVDDPEEPDELDAVSWTASEFISHQKSAAWYALLAAGALVVASLLYLLTRDVITTGVVLLGALVFGVYGAREPRQLPYTVTPHSIRIGDKVYDLDTFRSFAVVPEGAFLSIVFMPLKRFAVPLTIYFAPEDQERILGVLAGQLPFQEHSHDAIDQLMRRVRF